MVPRHERGYGSAACSTAACGIVAALIETADQAGEVARACRFAPRGQRSQITMVPQLGYRPTPARDLNPLLDRSAIVQILIETPRGIANADAIAAADGVDMLAVGANDLAAELGSPGDFLSSQFRDAVEQGPHAGARKDLCDLRVGSEIIEDLFDRRRPHDDNPGYELPFSRGAASIEALDRWQQGFPETHRSEPLNPIRHGRNVNERTCPCPDADARGGQHQAGLRVTPKYL
jgi:hypothetical protein